MLSTMNFEERKKVREKLIDSMSLQVIEGMDYKSLERYAYDQLSEYYGTLTDEELENEAFDCFGVDSIDEIV